MLKLFTFISTTLGLWSLVTGKAAAQDTSALGPTDRLWFNWWWILPLMALTVLFLLPQEGFPNDREDETDNLVGAKGGKSSAALDEDEDDVDTSEEAQNEEEQ